MGISAGSSLSVRSFIQPSIGMALSSPVWSASTPSIMKKRVEGSDGY